MSDEAWDDDFDEPPPPSRDDEELEHRIFNVVRYLDQVAANEDVAWSLCNALTIIRNYTRVRFPLRPDSSDRDRLLRAVTKARYGAISFLPPSYSRAQINTGFDALAGLICLWSESDVERAGREPHVFGEIVDYVKLLKNDVENIATVQAMRERAHERRAALIDELRLSAMSWAAA